MLSLAPSEDVLAMSKMITDHYVVTCIRPAQKTLVMVKMREPIKGSLFYLGEMLCSECMVEIEGYKGFAVIAGDDFAKTTAAAVIDAALNAGVLEAEMIITQLMQLRDQMQKVQKGINAQIMKSKVNFDVMGE